MKSFVFLPNNETEIKHYFSNIHMESFFSVHFTQRGRKINRKILISGRSTISHRWGANHIITARKRSLGQGNIFAPVYHSVHGGGEDLGRYPHLGPGTPPWDQVPPQTRWTPPGTRHTPPYQVHPLDQETPQPSTLPQTRYTPSGPGTPLRPGTAPRTRYTPQIRYTPPGTRYPPEAVHAGRYGQQAGGTHPTLTHSCLAIFLPKTA